MLNRLTKAAVTVDDIPPAIRNRPVLTQFQSTYWIAYQELLGSRQIGGSGIADIPYSEKIKWLDENWIEDSDDRQDYLFMINALDSAHLKHHYDKMKKKVQ
jgi:hypothetical protein